MTSKAYAVVAALFAFSASIMACGGDRDQGNVQGDEPEIRAAGLTCHNLPETFFQIYDDRTWVLVGEDEWSVGRGFSELEKKQIIAAVSVTAATVTTVEEAFEHVDGETINHIVFEKDGRKYVAIEYGAGDNSFGAMFVEGAETVFAKINDGDLSCPR